MVWGPLFFMKGKTMSFKPTGQDGLAAAIGACVGIYTFLCVLAALTKK